MKNKKSSVLSQKGFSLVEIMVAMTIGMILLGAVSYLFLGSRQINRSQNDMSRMQENGRYALETLGKAIRQTGGRGDVDLKFFQLASGGRALEATNGAGTAPDTLTVRYVPRTVETDCAGSAVAPSGVVTNIFSIDTTGARPKLMCSNGTSPAVAIADDIENMQVLVGTGPGNTVTNYISPPSTLDLPTVKAVRVSLLIRSPSNNVATSNQTYIFPEGADATSATDLHLRQVYTVTFNIRNTLE